MVGGTGAAVALLVCGCIPRSLCCDGARYHALSCAASARGASLNVSTEAKEITAAPMIMKAGLRSSAVRWTSQVATSGVSPPTMTKVVLKPSAIVVQRAAGGVASTMKAGWMPSGGPTSSTIANWPATTSVVVVQHQLEQRNRGQESERDGSEQQSLAADSVAEPAGGQHDRQQQNHGERIDAERVCRAMPSTDCSQLAT